MEFTCGHGAWFGTESILGLLTELYWNVRKYFIYCYCPLLQSPRAGSGNEDSWNMVPFPDMSGTAQNSEIMNRYFSECAS